ncbi:hypothetical protein N7463_005240 [Penicillium fimorum]|uniref:Uncharacterized protein n=1 Tax=Penicillium fimorum TaxID=1882269 RepID=A0A9W9XTE3_9EURO|nr:hypothetical protein N7463_005240 [Penicillium fimorum]
MGTKGKSALYKLSFAADFRLDKSTFSHPPSQHKYGIQVPDSADNNPARRRRRNRHLEDKCRRPRLVDSSKASGIAIETSNFLHLRMTVEMTSEGNGAPATWTFSYYALAPTLLRTSYALGCQIPDSITKAPMYRSILDLSKSNTDPASSAKVVLEFPGNGIGLHNVASERDLNRWEKLTYGPGFSSNAPLLDETGYVDNSGEGRNVPCSLALATSETLKRHHTFSIPLHHRDIQYDSQTHAKGRL